MKADNTADSRWRLIDIDSSNPDAEDGRELVRVGPTKADALAGLGPRGVMPWDLGSFKTWTGVAMRIDAAADGWDLEMITKLAPGYVLEKCP